MGSSKFSLKVIGLVFCLFITAAGTALAQPDDLGEVCMQFLRNTSSPLSVRLHVVRYSADTFQLVGKLPVPGDYYIPVHGAGVVDEDNILMMTLQGSNGSYIMSATYTLMIDLDEVPNGGTGTVQIFINERVFQIVGPPFLQTITLEDNFRFGQCP
jgi:hypothetical protein